MPKTVYTPEQITVAMALTKGGFPRTLAAKYSGVNRATITAVSLGRVKRGSIEDRYDAESAHRIGEVLRSGRVASLRAMAAAFREAASAIDLEIK